MIFWSGNIKGPDDNKHCPVKVINSINDIFEIVHKQSLETQDICEKTSTVSEECARTNNKTLNAGTLSKSFNTKTNKLGSSQRLSMETFLENDKEDVNDDTLTLSSEEIQQLLTGMNNTAPEVLSTRSLNRDNSATLNNEKIFLTDDDTLRIPSSKIKQFHDQWEIENVLPTTISVDEVFSIASKNMDEDMNDEILHVPSQQTKQLPSGTSNATSRSDIQKEITANKDTLIIGELQAKGSELHSHYLV
eukprot:Awhi_evm2s14835